MVWQGRNKNMIVRTFGMLVIALFLLAPSAAPGEYLYLMQGAVMVGKLLCTFTILTNDRASPEAEEALEMLRNAAHRGVM